MKWTTVVVEAKQAAFKESKVGETGRVKYTPVFDKGFNMLFPNCRVLRTTPDRLFLPLRSEGLWYIDLEFTTTKVDSTGKESTKITDKQCVHVDKDKLISDSPGEDK